VTAAAIRRKPLKQHELLGEFGNVKAH